MWVNNHTKYCVFCFIEKNIKLKLVLLNIDIFKMCEWMRNTGGKKFFDLLQNR